MRSVWLLEELGLDYSLHELEFSMASLRSPEYLAISPLGRVPCLVDGDVTLIESGAITQYLCETYDDGTLHRGPGHPERWAWLQWVHYAETIAVHGASLVQQTVFIRPEDRSEVVRKLETRRLEKALEVVGREVAERDWLLPSGFSAADVSVGYSVHLARQFTDLEAIPGVADYYGRLKAREAFRRSRGSRQGQASALP